MHRGKNSSEQHQNDHDAVNSGGQKRPVQFHQPTGGLNTTTITIIVVIILILVMACLFMGFYQGQIMAELGQLKDTKKDLFFTKNRLKSELERSRKECEKDRQNDISNCRDNMKQLQDTFDGIANSNKDEAADQQIQLKQRNKESSQQWKAVYEQYANSMKKDKEDYKYYERDCMKKLADLRKEENKRLADVTKAATHCQAEIGFKTSQLQSCEYRLNRSSELLKSKGVETIY